MELDSFVICMPSTVCLCNATKQIPPRAIPEVLHPRPVCPTGFLGETDMTEGYTRTRPFCSVTPVGRVLEYSRPACLALRLML